VAVDEAEKQLRDASDRSLRVEHERERARRELDEIGQRADALDAERSQLADVVTLVRRERDEAALAAVDAVARLGVATTELDTARAEDRQSREREAAARAELFRADEALVALQGKVNALEGLERERVGLAPAAARLLKERERFGENVVLGPLSDFITADQASALLVERFLGATVHAVLVRDAAAAEAVREWHAEANPGPLLLLPLDAAPTANGMAAPMAGVSRRWFR
jgi:chromosome segregation protein